MRRRRCVAVVAPKWFLCLFVNSLPFETVLREGGKTTKETIQHSTSTHAGDKQSCYFWKRIQIWKRKVFKKVGRVPCLWDMAQVILVIRNQDHEEPDSLS